MRWAIAIIGSALLLPAAAGQESPLLPAEPPDLPGGLPEDPVPGLLQMDVGAHDLDCPSDRGPHCFVLGEAELAPGDVVVVTLNNNGTVPHALSVATLEAAGTGRPAGLLLARSDTIVSGGQTTFTFQVPTAASGLYLWCDIDDHEALGMWVGLPFDGPVVHGEPAAVSPATQASPMPWWLVVVAVGVVALWRR